MAVIGIVFGKGDISEYHPPEGYSKPAVQMQQLWSPDADLGDLPYERQAAAGAVHPEPPPAPTPEPVLQQQSGNPAAAKPANPPKASLGSDGPVAAGYIDDSFWATRYGVHFNGDQMGCPGSGVYSSDDPSIVAVGPGRYGSIPCGTVIEIHHRKSGRFIIAVRQDSCPGCELNHLDLSEAGIAALCGGPCDIINGLQVKVIEVK